MALTFERVPSQHGKSKRFVPKSLYPYGGFGDPNVEKPYFRVPRGTENDNALQAAAQERLARRVRQVLEQIGMSEADLEHQLEYRRTGLVRKLSGHEQMTMRDVARLSTFFGGDVFTALSARDPKTGEYQMVAEPTPLYTRRSDSGKNPVRDLIADASARLSEAGSLLRNSKDSGTGEVLSHLAKAVASLGSNLGGSRK